MLVYLIPLISPDVCKDWKRVSILCERTVRCLLASPNENLRVVLVGNKIPFSLDDKRLHLIEEDFELPKSWEDGHTDKYCKIERGLVFCRRWEEFWLMKVDADDLVSTRVPEFVENLPADASGALVERGYVHPFGKSFCFKQGNFHIFCGTSSILRVSLEDLPTEVTGENFDFLPMKLGHNIVKEHFEKLGNPLHSIPFPAAVYSVGHGENHSGLSWPPKSRKQLLKKLLRIRAIGMGLEKRFPGMNQKF